MEDILALCLLRQPIVPGYFLLKLLSPFFPTILRGPNDVTDRSSVS